MVDTRKSTSEDAIQQIKELRTIVEQLVEDNKELKNKLEESLKSTQFASDKYDENNNKLNEVLGQLSIITKQNVQLIEKNEILEKEIDNYKRERLEMEKQLFEIITPIETQRREKNLEIHGLSESDGENCSAVVKAVIEKVTPKPVAVAKCFRFGSTETLSGETRIRPIMVQFDKKEDRELIYTNRSKLREYQDPVYINENLPRHLRILRGKANARKKKHNWKYIWSKNGNILLRKTDGSKVINIKATIDLELIK